MNFMAKDQNSSSARSKDQLKSDAALADYSRLDPDSFCARFESSPSGLSQDEAERRLIQYGPNRVTREQKATILQELWTRTRNPLNALLLTLAVVSYFLGDMRAAIVIGAMVILAITTAFIQEHRSNEAAARLRAMVHRHRQRPAGRHRSDGKDLQRNPDGETGARRHRPPLGRRHDSRPICA